MAYFVTGATGFIGRFVVANLLKRGKPIYVLVPLLGGMATYLAVFHSF